MKKKRIPNRVSLHGGHYQHSSEAADGQFNNGRGRWHSIAPSPPTLSCGQRVLRHSLDEVEDTALYVLIAGGCLQVIGVGLFSSLDSNDLGIPSAQYGYQVIMGFGFGLGLSTILLMTPMIVQPKDLGK